MSQKDTLVWLKNVALYQNNQVILNHVDFQVNKKDFFYIVGRTGSGKSTLLRTIYADIALHSGIGSVLEYNLRTIKTVQIPIFEKEIRNCLSRFSVVDRSKC